MLRPVAAQASVTTAVAMRQRITDLIALAANIRMLIFRAAAANTAPIFIGSGLVDTNGVEVGYALAAGDSLVAFVIDGATEFYFKTDAAQTLLIEQFA